MQPTYLAASRTQPLSESEELIPVIKVKNWYVSLSPMGSVSGVLVGTHQHEGVSAKRHCTAQRSADVGPPVLLDCHKEALLKG
mmetsp:Transcript_8435/g.15894  ORF Transcript_8435/g.15894 Transcript_8435/m.15894 type:complete len:83 (-) Transcript_8435:155-403(-)|eukprot:CAMPEP_0114475712 /NCGR_PEP_ID=MMETSP0104-20121206/14319_1 /TAXON_ID=37642 ORGANISM="Paraphysomonas imperforata, Strain PA2" /NCGR_SAMPLE_ID=MMETSP0104 /ASSEMBLY_ACC=CAM_ASM_000202 /LENGTH=82 /DNA_ID=CAMNT_0001650297 /DNA_START=531 /DNA_END=779 /DNA_ORIENTATION=+